MEFIFQVLIAVTNLEQFVCVVAVRCSTGLHENINRLIEGDIATNSNHRLAAKRQQLGQF